MGLYQDWLVPRLVELAMQNRALESYRRATVGKAQGRVLEIGVGSGFNLPLYDRTVDHVFAIDPSPELLRLARERASAAVVPVSLLRASAEQLPFTDTVFDTVLMTWTLCSIPHPVAALKGMRRIIRPAGRLLFVEHGRSPEPSIEPWQHW